jgi:hypothetical protein
MSCRKAFDIDLAAFLSDAGGDEFAEFRGHYPVCADCSAEVRTWTDLHALLQAGPAGPSGGHPEPEVLLRYEQRDPPLGSAETARVERHLARCNTCREELTALRRFDFSALSTEVAQPEPVRSRLADLLTGLRGLLLHPAFAYALVLILLYPTVTSYLEGPGVPEPSLAMLSDKPKAQERHDAEAARPEIARLEATRSETGRPPSEVRQPAKAPQELRRDVAPLPPQPKRKQVAEIGKERARMRTEPPPPAPAQDLPVAGAFAYRAAPVLGEADTAEEFAPEPAQMLRSAAQFSAPAGPTPPWILRLRVPEEVRGALRFEVRVVHAEGLREVRQRFVSAEAGDEVEVSLPLDWKPTNDDRVEFKTLP